MKPRSLLAVTVCLLLVTVALLPVQSFTPQPASVELGEFLYTVSLSKEKNPNEAAQEWYHEYLEPEVNDSLFGPLLQMISDNSIAVYKPVYPFTEKCTNAEARGSIIRADSTQIEDPDRPGKFIYIVAHAERRADHVRSVTFHEVWTYDAATLTLVKTVKGIILNVDWGWGTEPRVRPSVYIPFTGEPEVNAPINVSLTYRFASDGTMRGQRVTSKTVSDAAVTANQTKVQNQLLADVKSKPADKNFTVYDASFPFTIVADKAMKSTMTATLPVANGLLFYESWEINSRSRTFRKVVKGIIPQIEKSVTATDGSVQFEYRKLAFIPFNRYVPEGVAPLTTVAQIDYNVNFRHSTDRYSGYVPVYPQLHPRDSVKLDSVAADVGEHIKRYEVKAFAGEAGNFFFDPFTHNDEELSQEAVSRFFSYGDSVYVEDPQNPSELKSEYREYTIGHDVNNGFRFYESWTFNPTAYVFTKDIMYVGMNALIQDPYGENGKRSVCRYFYYNPRTPVEAIRKPEYLIGRNVISSVLLNDNEFYTEEDDDGRAIARYADITHENIDASERYAMFQPMIQSILDEKIKVKPTVESRAFMTVAGFSDMIAAVINKNKLQVARGMEFVLFNELFFYEDWYYNPATAQFYKEVKAITFAHREPNISVRDNSDLKVSNVQPCFTLVVNQSK